MSDVITTVGAFAGIAAILGLVVLSMLCFSMSRDLRRLREWAGGAPERDAEVREVSEVVAAERSEELRVLAEREERRMDRGGEGEGNFWERLGRTGRIIAIVAAVVVVGAAAAFAGTTLLGGSDSGKSNSKTSKKAAVDPGKYTVAVLNGTVSETGVASDYANKVEKVGYKLGEVTNTTSSYSNSIVMYTKGNEAAAKAVAKSVNIKDTGVVTPEIAAVAGNADVTVVVGLDHGSVP